VDENAPEASYQAPPEGNGYEWIWEDWMKNQGEGEAPQTTGGYQQSSVQEPVPTQQPTPDWMDAFDQLFYGPGDQDGNQGGDNGVDQEEEWDEQQTWIEPEPSHQAWSESQQLQTWIDPQQQTYDDTQQQTYGTIQQQAYDDSQQTWTDQQIVPTTEDIPVVPVINNTQERTMDLYNTDQCIHTYNVVNTVEEVGI
jgi:hypothetical protein